MKKVNKEYRFAGEKTPAKALFMLNLKNTNKGGKFIGHFRLTNGNGFYTMKTIIKLILTLSLCQVLKAQTNLVPNCSFETITTCTLGNLYTEPPWNSPSNGSPDAYNSCSISSVFDIPTNNFGFQYAHSGNGYSGASFYGFSGGSYFIEYLQVELDTNLIANNIYCASFYISLANKSRYAIKNIGMYFSNSNVSQPIIRNLNFIPQIADTNHVTDTLNWVYFEGNFTAMGGERYLIIGNFNDSTHTDTMTVGHTGGDAYYYIDDVDVHYCPSGQGVEEVSDDRGVKVWPNPCEGELRIRNYELGIKEVRMYDVLGNEILKQVQNDKSATIDVSGLAKGMYFVEVKTEKGIVRRKVVKE